MKQLLKLTGCVALAGLMSSCGSVQEEANYQIIPLPQEIVTSQPLYFEKRCENPLSGRK
jgi:hexosaminidase